MEVLNELKFWRKNVEIFDSSLAFLLGDLRSLVEDGRSIKERCCKSLCAMVRQHSKKLESKKGDSSQIREWVSFLTSHDFGAGNIMSQIAKDNEILLHLSSPALSESKASILLYIQMIINMYEEVYVEHSRIVGENLQLKQKSKLDDPRLIRSDIELAAHSRGFLHLKSQLFNVYIPKITKLIKARVEQNAKALKQAVGIFGGDPKALIPMTVPEFPVKECAEIPGDKIAAFKDTAAVFEAAKSLYIKHSVKIEEFRTKLDAKIKGLDALKNISRTYSETPSLGNATAADTNIATTTIQIECLTTNLEHLEKKGEYLKSIIQKDTPENFKITVNYLEAISIYSHEAKDERQLSMFAGEILRVDHDLFISETSNGWINVVNQKYQEGLVPINHLKLATPLEAEALYPYKGAGTSELTMKEHDTVLVYRKFDDGWAEGSLGGRKGTFPFNYVRFH